MKFERKKTCPVVAETYQENATYWQTEQLTSRLPYTPKPSFWRSNKQDLMVVATEIIHFPMLFIFFNPLPVMPILGSSNSAANKDVMSKKYGQLGIKLSD